MTNTGLTGVVELKVEQLDSRGRGVGRYGETRVICDGALPGEQVRVSRYEKRRHMLKALSFDIIQNDKARIDPLCRYFGECGGCQLQHARHEAQLAYKENYLRQCLEQYGDVSPEQWMPGQAGAAFHYRRRVRLRVRVNDEGEVILGLHRKNRSYLLDLDTCPVLESRLHDLLVPLHRLVSTLSIRHRLPQIEMSAGEQEVAVVFRHLLPFSRDDLEQLAYFAKEHQALVFTQLRGPESVMPLNQAQPRTLQYHLCQHGVRLCFAPTDFMQANAGMNEKLVESVLQQLDIHKEDAILDLYCGIGNFSLPLARYAQRVTGIESHPGLVARARSNAQLNGLHNLDFQRGDLDSWVPEAGYTKVLLDPPREGAINVIKQLPTGLKKIVYVSCLPRTLARDARYLVHRSGYRLVRAGVVDMFPQTRHVEAVAVFERG